MKEKIYKGQKADDANMLPGDRNGSPDNCFIFVDAGSLSKLSKCFGKGKYLRYNLIKFIENLCEGEKYKCQKIFYYTAPPFQSQTPIEEEIERKKKYDKFIKKISDSEKITIRQGRCQRLKLDGKFIFKQKAVDSLRIIDLMKIPIENIEIKKIILIASDSDFVPIIEHLRKLKIKITLYTHYSKNRGSNLSRSNALLKIVDKYKEIKKEDFEKCPLEQNKKQENLE